MADFDLRKITGREPPVETDEDMMNALADALGDADALRTERDALRERVASEYHKGHVAGQEAAMESVAALRARVAELEGDLNVARLQLSARVCSECPAKEGVAELAQLLDEGSAYVHSFAMLSKHPTAPAYAMDLAQRMRSAAGLSGNKTAP